MFYPNEKEFVKLARKGNLIPVYKEIVADMETPVSAYKKIEGLYSFLLESVEGGENIARYSFLGRCSKEEVFQLKSIKEIRGILARYKAVSVPGLPRFHGGLVGYVGYDMVREIEAIPDQNPDDLANMPICFLLARTLLAFDHVKHKILIISNAEIKDSPRRAYREACRKIELLESGLKKPLQLEREEFEIPTQPKKTVKIASNMSRKQFEDMVRKGKEHIRAGDIIQVVLSQRLEAECKAEPFKVYRSLRVINPSPYMYYFDFGDLKIAGSSPEVMVRLERGRAILRPIAGTRGRGKGEAEEKKMERDLLASKKEKAEHIMLVDLGRNDLGRVCKVGTVKVSDLMHVEKYSHVMHIVSNISGEIMKNKDAVDLLFATFPAGTVSGAPKVRAMEIIDELENVKRSIYAGCVGYFGFTGEMDTCITIRTIIFKGKKAYVQAGAGIVADSLPAFEYNETLNKAKGMLKAIELVQ